MRPIEFLQIKVKNIKVQNRIITKNKKKAVGVIASTGGKELFLTLRAQALVVRHRG